MVNQVSDAAEVKPLLIPVEAVAKLLGVSIRSVWRLRSSRKIIEPVRIGGVVRWKLDEVNRWVEEGCPEPAPLPVKLRR